jgi:hypothetical protein
MELPREIQVYIYSFIYDKWRKEWKKVVEEIECIENRTKYYIISRFMRKEYLLPKQKEFTICLECGNYYKPRLYSSLAMYCDCA